jgi:hypothetical protein
MFDREEGKNCGTVIRDRDFLQDKKIGSSDTKAVISSQGE